MLHFIAGFLAGCPVWIPTGAYLFYRYGSALKADAQAIGGMRVRDAVKK